MRQLILDLLPDTPPRFDNFVAGGNGEALAALAAWLGAANRESSLLLWGETGAGKTHLLRASGGLYSDAAADPDLSCLGENQEEIHPLHAIDNVEALNATGQVALFNLFNRQRASGRRLLTAASRPPLQLALREDLRTRLGWGQVHALQPLGDEDVRKALQQGAAERGLELGDEVVNYMLSRFSRDLGSLNELLGMLDGYALEQRRALTVPLLKQMLNET